MSEAIIFVPGNDSKIKGQRLHELVEDLKNYNNVGQVKILDKTELYGHESKRLEVNTFDGKSKTVDIYEAFWSDLKPGFDQMKPHLKLIKGLSTCIYWLNPKIWRAANNNLSKILIMIFSGILLIFWYLMVFITAIALLSKAEIHTQIDFIDQYLPIILSFVNEKLGDTQSLVYITVLTGFLPINRLGTISYNAMIYLKDEALRNRIRRRISDILFDIQNQPNNYTKVTLLSHSFGTVIGTHFISDLKLEGAKFKFHFITLGAALSFLKQRTNWLRTTYDNCYNNKFLEDWIDYYSLQDWLSSSAQLQDKNKKDSIRKPENCKHCSTKLTYSNNIIEQLLNAGKIHALYTKTTKVVDAILS